MQELQDFDSDDDLDVIVCFLSDCTILSNTLSSEWPVAFQWSPSCSEEFPLLLASGDIDKDGFPDFVTACGQPDNVIRWCASE